MSRIVMLWYSIATIYIIAGCALLTKQNARTVLNVTELACVLAHEEITDVESVATVCGIVDTLAPALDELLRARAVAAKARVLSCP